MPFCFVDAFAPSPLPGNSLSIVPEADDLSLPQMQVIAREFNQSETTFLHRATKRGLANGCNRSPRSVSRYSARDTTRWARGSGRPTPGGWRPAGRRSFKEIGDDLLPVEISSAGGIVEVTMDQSVPIAGGVAEDRAGLAAPSAWTSPTSPTDHADRAAQDRVGQCG